MNRGRLYILMATALAVVAALCGCQKGEVQIPASSEPTITFGLGVPEQMTRVTVSDTANESGKFSVNFDENDQIGLYLYYNYYFVWDASYGFAESVIFANDLLTANAGGATASASNTKAWTFSTIYGTKPYRYDAIAYYPHTTTGDANKWSNSDIFQYTYHVGDFTKHADFMIGTAKYQGTGDDEDTQAANFRSEILASKTNIPLSFSRKTASVNICVTKAPHITETIVVNSLDVYVKSFGVYEFSQNSGIGEWKVPNTATTHIPYADLDADVAELDPTPSFTKTRAATVANPGDLVGEGTKVSDDLIKTHHLYVPEGTYFNKVVFNITVGITPKKYVWHPHTPTIKANTHYTLNLELDPERAN